MTSKNARDGALAADPAAPGTIPQGDPERAAAPRAHASSGGSLPRYDLNDLSQAVYESAQLAAEAVKSATITLSDALEAITASLASLNSTATQAAAAIVATSDLPEHEP